MRNEKVRTRDVRGKDDIIAYHPLRPCELEISCHLISARRTIWDSLKLACTPRLSSDMRKKRWWRNSNAQDCCPRATCIPICLCHRGVRSGSFSRKGRSPKLGYKKQYGREIREA